MGYGRLTGRQVLGVLPTVVVNAETGSTIALSKGALALNAVENNGVWTFTCPTFGTWIASDGNKTSAVEVDDIKLYNTEISSATVYGFHIDSSVSDPSEAVTYLEDAVGMTPAFMDYSNDTFNYGSWENAFFMPKPCMLKYDGIVDYYLDPDDYSKKADGTDSDIADDTYEGNAMMEWGQNGKKIWYKIVPDTGDSTSASIYIANGQMDSDYRAWSFVNNDGDTVDHFYTPIYNGSVVDSRLRSLSGKTQYQICQYKTAEQEVAYAEANNTSSNNLWYTECFADVVLINLLLVLMSKSLDTLTAFGNGVRNQSYSAADMIGTGTMNDKGMFWGANVDTSGVKVFGMENYWGNQLRRYAGYILDNYTHKIKLTRGTQDGSSASDYNLTGSGYISAGSAPTSNGFIKAMQWGNDCFTVASIDGSSTTYWCNYWQSRGDIRYACRGGYCYTSSGLFQNVMNALSTDAYWHIGASPSCKPSA